MNRKNMFTVNYQLMIILLEGLIMNIKYSSTCCISGIKTMPKKTKQHIKGEAALHGYILEKQTQPPEKR